MASVTDKAIKLLEKTGLKNTSSRRSVLSVFIDNEFALNYHEIQEKLQEKLDKVTIYRSLKKFEEVGIIHQVPDMSGTIRYALCAHQCNNNHHKDSHVHFNCQKCEKTYCIEDTQIPLISLPKNYLIDDMMVLVRGICNDCRTQLTS